MNSNLKALILAGGNKRINHINKHFIRLKDKPIVQNSIDALYENNIWDITLVCRKKDIDNAANLEGKVNIVGSKNDFAENLEIAKELVDKKEDPVLVLYGDHPFTRGHSLKYFLGQCNTAEYDAFHGGPTKDSIDNFKEFYHVGYVHAREFEFRSGSMLLIKPHKIDYSFLNAVYKIRMQEKIRNTAKLGGLIFWTLRKKWGWDTLGAIALYLRHIGIRFLYNHGSELYYAKLKNSESSSIKYLEAYAARALSLDGERLRVKAIPMPFGELSMDIDNFKDYENYERNYEKILNIMGQERNNIKY
ncbi:MAG: NTP transferase domain-containing protein [Nanoarchaeota archaeon]